MAMKACRECGKEVSTEAKTCPHCGVKSPVRKGLGLGSKIVLGIFALGILGAILSNSNNGPTSNKSTPKKPTIDKSAAAQKKREGTLQKAKQYGFISGADCGTSSVAHLLVRPAFQIMTFEQKAGLAVTLYEWCFDGSESGMTMVAIRDDRDRSRAGSYSPATGLQLP